MIKEQKEFNKIFIIGLNKTATTTIHNMFLQNNFKSVHWHLPRYSKYKKNGIEESVLNNLKNNNNLLDKELDKNFQVFSDIHNLSINFELLDIQYPNSLFIYNYRNINNWILSRLNFLNGNYINYWRIKNNKNNLSDKEVIKEWINLYNNHHEKVMNYFKNKENIVYYNIEEETMDFFIKKLPFKLKNIKIEKKLVTKNKFYKFEENEFKKIII